MLTKKKIATLFLLYWNEELFEEGEVAEISDSKEAEKMYQGAKARLYKNLDGEGQRLLEAMLSARDRTEMYHNIHYLWRGYLTGKEIGAMGENPL